jgi:COP9 signalosome complex subunit 5
MGLLLGRPDDEDLNCMIITGESSLISIVTISPPNLPICSIDAQALPIEGFETRVIADDQDVINYMISLGENNELSTKETFCGWYHTHPFDLDEHSHCYLSATDVSTQLSVRYT